jgi:hypothetical protein
MSGVPSAGIWAVVPGLVRPSAVAVRIGALSNTNVAHRGATRGCIGTEEKGE